MTAALYLRWTLTASLILSAATLAFSETRSRPSRPTPSATPARPSLSRPLSPVSPTPAANQPMRKAADMIRTQPPLNINGQLLQILTPEAAHVIVSIGKQRAYLMLGDQVVIDSPVSSGKRGHSSPTGKFTVLEKDKSHHSSIYGDYKDSSGRTVRGGVSARIDSAPSGTHFVGAEMKWFMRLTQDGVGMHVGILPGYPASHGCIRMPSQAAELFYQHVREGTPVNVMP